MQPGSNKKPTLPLAKRGKQVGPVFGAVSSNLRGYRKGTLRRERKNWQHYRANFIFCIWENGVVFAGPLLYLL
jgi:hypothetical protein